MILAKKNFTLIIVNISMIFQCSSFILYIFMNFSMRSSIWIGYCSFCHSYFLSIPNEGFNWEYSQYLNLIIVEVETLFDVPPKPPPILPDIIFSIFPKSSKKPPSGSLFPNPPNPPNPKSFIKPPILGPKKSSSSSKKPLFCCLLSLLQNQCFNIRSQSYFDFFFPNPKSLKPPPKLPKSSPKASLKISSALSKVNPPKDPPEPKFF